MRIFLLENDPFSEAIRSFLSLYPRTENITVTVYSDFKQVRKKTEVQVNPLQTVPVMYDQEHNLAYKSVEAIFWRFHDFIGDEMFVLSTKGMLVFCVYLVGVYWGAFFL